MPVLWRRPGPADAGAREPALQRREGVPPDGTGRIAVLAAGAEVLLLCVEDNGRGISPAAQHLIFESFSRPRTRPPASPRAPGLGLAITRKIVELHHGRIWVESARAGPAFPSSCPYLIMNYEL